MEDPFNESMEESFDEFFESVLNLDLYKGTQITRWSSRNYIKPENDCEHQNIVTQIVLYLCELYSIDIKTYRDAVALASIHDMFEYAEGGMGDIPHSVKMKSKEIKEIVEQHEKETIENIEVFGDAWKKFSKNSLAVTIVELADALDVQLYIQREFSLGNQDKDFKSIDKLSKIRILSIFRNFLQEFYSHRKD